MTSPISYSQTSYRVMKQSTPYFTGRDKALKTLEAFFSPLADKSQGGRRFLLYGMGGAGKTQISLKFAEEYSNR